MVLTDISQLGVAMTIENAYPECAFGIQYLNFHSNSFLDILKHFIHILQDYWNFYFEKIPKNFFKEVEKITIKLKTL